MGDSSSPIPIPAFSINLFSTTDREVWRQGECVIARWNEATQGLKVKECEKRLMEGQPRIAVLTHSSGGLLFTVFMNDPGDKKHLARRMKEIFGARA